TVKNYRLDLMKFIIWYESHYPSPLHKAKGQIIEDYRSLLLNGGKFTSVKKKTYFLEGIFILFQKLFIREKSTKIIDQPPMAKSSSKRHLSSIKNFFEYLKQYYEDKNGRFLINPVKNKIHGIKLKEIDINHTPMLDQSDWNQLEQDLFRTKERLVCFLLYYCGLRLEELTKLQFKHFDFESHTMKIVRKGGKVHFFKPQMAQDIFYLLKIHKVDVQSDWLFPSKSKTSSVTPRSMYHYIKRILKKSGLKSLISPHSFRKACATNLYLKTKDLLFVRDYLNHSDAKVTQTYIDSKTLTKHGLNYH
ncbi:MAG: site-specific integrase, partial [Bacteriovoracaceae bacterium]|nr:site-specific integrase [Bacteriovoracaceae bacterium]